MKQFESLLVLDSEQTFVPPIAVPVGRLLMREGATGYLAAGALADKPATPS